MEITPMVSMAAESTDTERAQTSASHRHHHTHRATPIDSHDLRGSPRLHARETQQQIEDPCSDQENIDVVM